MITLSLSTCKLIMESSDPISNLADYDYGEGRYTSYKMNKFTFTDLITNVPLAQIFMSDDTCYKLALGIHSVCDNIGLDNNNIGGGGFRIFTVKPIYCWRYDHIGLISISRDNDGNVSLSFIQSYPITDTGTIYKITLNDQECATLYNAIVNKDTIDFKYF